MLSIFCQIILKNQVPAGMNKNPNNAKYLTLNNTKIKAINAGVKISNGVFLRQKINAIMQAISNKMLETLKNDNAATSFVI